jgi:septum formation protein
MQELVLASTSPYRRMLLERLGLPFRTVTPGFDEKSLPWEKIEPIELTRLLAFHKAESVSRTERDAMIIGCDQVVSFDGKVIGKPVTQDAAIEQLLAMSGREHELITGLVVMRQEEVRSHVDVTRLWMRQLSRLEIERYVERDQPLDCAGSYKLEQAGITLFERIESADQSAIVGMPLIALTTILRELGFPVP